VVLSKQLVYVEVIPETGQIIRIIKLSHEAYRLEPERVQQVAKKVAVEEIRRAVFKRATDDDGIVHCEDCGKRIDWYTGHMHERLAKGKGGEVSVENSVAICPYCHLQVEHGDRRFQSSKIRGEQ
jgi:hypothetical protein